MVAQIAEYMYLFERVTDDELILLTRELNTKKDTKKKKLATILFHSI